MNQKRRTTSEEMQKKNIAVDTLQQAVIWSEILGRPVSKRRRGLDNGNQNHVGRR